MGIYFAEGVYGIKCVNPITNQVFYEVVNETKYSGEEINQIIQLTKNISQLFDVYFYKQFSTTYNLDSKPGFMWVQSKLSIKNEHGLN